MKPRIPGFTVKESSWMVGGLPKPAELREGDWVDEENPAEQFKKDKKMLIRLWKKLNKLGFTIEW